MRESSEMADSFGSYSAGGISDAAAVARTLAGEREAYRVLVSGTALTFIAWRIG